LIDEDQPNFVASAESAEAAEEMDFGEETVIRLEKPSVPKPPPDPEIHRSDQPRIVIPMNEERAEQRVRARQIPPYQPIPPKNSTAKVVVLTILGTIGVLAFGFTLFYLLQTNDEGANTNLNVNTNPPNANMNVNLNTNLGLGNFNYNINTNTALNTNIALNLNTNANRTPSPTPKPSPTPTSSNVNVNLSESNMSTPTPRPTASPTPAAPPRPSPSFPKSSNANH
jgi:hypothetical protein